MGSSPKLSTKHVVSVTSGIKRRKNWHNWFLLMKFDPQEYTFNYILCYYILALNFLLRQLVSR